MAPRLTEVIEQPPPAEALTGDRAEDQAEAGASGAAGSGVCTSASVKLSCPARAGRLSRATALRRAVAAMLGMLSRPAVRLAAQRDVAGLRSAARVVGRQE